MNTQEREQLERELRDLNDFIQVKRRLFTVDQKGRLAFYRNAQHSNQLETRFVLEGLGTRVTIIEKQHQELDEKEQFYNSTFELVDIVVEALPENRL